MKKKRSFRRGSLALLVCLGVPSLAQAQIQINVNTTLPGDINVNGGAPAATLQQSAAFAWQEFIALSWPALAGQRDVPDPNQKFGSGSGPLVWQTFRSKIEIFNVVKTGKTMYLPPGYSTTAPNYGYNNLPTYFYSLSEIPACQGQTAPAVPAWINLDETTQIDFAQMFAGGPPINSANNTMPQLIRFAVKANGVQYGYIAEKGYYNKAKVPSKNANMAFTGKTPVAPQGDFVYFPPGTIEIKSAWRPLTSNDDPTHFHRQTVRFYEDKGPVKDNKNTPCYFEEQWGLIALHIIQKTPSAPSFIYATFEQGENIKQPNGGPVEDLDGNVVSPSASPTTPSMSYADSPTDPKVTANGGACTPNNQLYFRDKPSDSGLTRGIAVCVNQRYESIPPDVVTVNQAAHAAIAAYNTANQVQNSPWPYYKLVSVQASPFDFSTITPSDPTHSAAVFFQANIVVETNYLLQQFKGRINQDTGAPTSYPPPPPVPPPPAAQQYAPPPNVFTVKGSSATGVNMGGCMGCHGNAQVGGFDFSFILQNGAFPAPDTPSKLGLPDSPAKVGYKNPNPAALPNFAAVQKFFNDFVTGNRINIGLAPHGTFWQQTGDSGRDYNLFVTGTMPGGITDPNTGNPIPILIVGAGERSNIVYALRGTAGTLWDPENPTGFGQMPLGGPYFSEAQIQMLSDWITSGAPQ